jgi:hypothetical protein
MDRLVWSNVIHLWQYWSLSYIQNLKFLWKIILYFFQQKQVVKILNDIINIQRYDYKGVALNFHEINNMVSRNIAKFFEQ